MREFEAAFQSLTGNRPMPWQARLYEDWFSRGEFPSSCSIPTGLGKTSVIHIWLIALAYSASSNNGPRLPRRLVYVVNRRTVVDQTTTEIMRLRERAATVGIDRLAVSTLRGQLADNQEWSADPSRPAVICGTVDMIGSRLLFGGYRVGFKGRPLHAGFLGQDVLLVHDEAHLEPAFQALIEAIEQEQIRDERTGDLPWPKLRVMALSATTRNSKGVSDTGKLFGLTEDEKRTTDEKAGSTNEAIGHVWRRLNARKRMILHQSADDRASVARDIASLAANHKDANAAVLVFVRTLDDLDRIEKELSKTKRPIVTLTGTMRGKERDELVVEPVFRRFLKGADAGETVYLLCTSAGEVGIDMSADHLVCDLSTLEGMIQRFGRVNRYGDGDARIDVVYPTGFDEKSKIDSARENTLDALKQLPSSPRSEGESGVKSHDASPKALCELVDSLPEDKRDAAFAPIPTILPTSDILFDAWTMTTIRGPMPGRPPIAPFLHGLAEWEPPETHVAWREEVGIITGDLLDRHPPEELLDLYPLKPHELLRDRSDRVFDKLQLLASRLPDEPVWILEPHGEVRVYRLAELADPAVKRTQDKKPLVDRIGGRTVLLSPEVGGLRGGMFEGTSEVAEDVSDIDAGDVDRRIRLWSNDDSYEEKTGNMRLVRSIVLDLDAAAEEQERPTWDWYKHRPIEDTRTARSPVCLNVHVDDVVNEIDGILSAISLPADLANAVRLAAKLHDHGKRRHQFQLTLGNRMFPEVIWAKSGRVGARLPEPYRHEFGSMVDAWEHDEFRKLSPEMQDVVLHLIAAHHGRARPHFPLDEVFDTAEGRGQAELERLAAEVPRRFARLQRRYGRWGLAYLESLLRAADWAASARPSEYANEAREVAR